MVFNNAGCNCPSSLIGDVSWEDWRKVMSVNIDGSFLVARGAFRMMKEQKPQGGRIINNGSISAHAPRYGSTPYTASKHAVTGLTKALALDGRAFDIVVSQIDIGNAATPLTARMSGGVPQADGTMRPRTHHGCYPCSGYPDPYGIVTSGIEYSFYHHNGNKGPLCRPGLIYPFCNNTGVHE